MVTFKKWELVSNHDFKAYDGHQGKILTYKSKKEPVKKIETIIYDEKYKIRDFFKMGAVEAGFFVSESYLSICAYTSLVNSGDIEPSQAMLCFAIPALNYVFFRMSELFNGNKENSFSKHFKDTKNNYYGRRILRKNTELIETLSFNKV